MTEMTPAQQDAYEEDLDALEAAADALGADLDRQQQRATEEK